MQDKRGKTMERNEIMERLEQLKNDTYIYEYGNTIDVTFKTDNPTPNKSKIIEVLSWLRINADYVEGGTYKSYYFNNLRVCVGMFKIEYKGVNYVL